MAAAAAAAGSGVVGKVMLQGSEAVFLVLHAAIAYQTRSENVAHCVSERNTHAGRSRGCSMGLLPRCKVQIACQVLLHFAAALMNMEQ